MLSFELLHKLIHDLKIKNFLFNISLLTSSMCSESLPERKSKERQNKMANIKSAKKRVLIAERNRLRNQAFRSSIKTAVKKVLELAKAEDKDALKTALSKAYQLCDKAVSKGVLHKNTAARKKSRLTKAVNKLQAE